MLLYTTSSLDQELFKNYDKLSDFIKLYPCLYNNQEKGFKKKYKKKEFGTKTEAEYL